jgi:hypothetical protein
VPGSSQPREQYKVYAFHGEILVTIQLFQNRTSEISADDTGHVGVDQVGVGQVGFFFGNVELSLELWTVISGISGFDY